MPDQLFSCGSYLSEMSVDSVAVSEIPEQRSKDCSLRDGDFENPFDDTACAEPNSLTKKRWNPFDDANSQGIDEAASTPTHIDKAHLLCVLASSDSEDVDIQKSAPGSRWNWLKGKGRRPAAPTVQAAAAVTAPLDGPSAKMGSALKVARAGPAAPPVDLSRIESESNPETLRGLLRRLFADREELASRNWALDATNRCLDAELEEAQLKVKHLEEAAHRSHVEKAELEQEVARLRLVHKTAQSLAGAGMNETPSDAQVDELHSELAVQKTMLAQAEFELMGLRQELRTSRRATRESGASSQSRSASPRQLPGGQRLGARPVLVSCSDDAAELHHAVSAIQRALSSAGALPVRAA